MHLNLNEMSGKEWKELAWVPVVHFQVGKVSKLMEFEREYINMFEDIHERHTDFAFNNSELSKHSNTTNLKIQTWSRAEKSKRNRYLASHNFFSTFPLHTLLKASLAKVQRDFFFCSFDVFTIGFSQSKIRLNVALGAPEMRKGSTRKTFLSAGI